MKYIVLLLFVLSLGTAYGQQLHMIEMSTNNAALGNLSYNESGRGSSDSYSSSFYFAGNYAYTIAPRVQLGMRGNYSKFNSSSSDSEAYGVSVGAIYNFDDKLTEAFYASVYAGFDWYNYYGTGNSRTESKMGMISLGKRFHLGNIGMATVTYSPEISFKRSEQTDYTYHNNNYAIRFLQFSAFF